MSISWRPGIGDPTLLGWLTVAAYVVATVLCVRAARHFPLGKSARKESRCIWVAFASLMLLMALNKQLDLQTLLIEIGRRVAQAQGWYEQRQGVKVGFILVGGGGLLAGLALMVWRFRRFFRRRPLLALGPALLLGYVLARALATPDGSRGFGVHSRPWTPLLELGGITCVAVSAALAKSEVSPGDHGGKYEASVH